MLKNNKLVDLFVRGKEVVVADSDKEVRVWLQKLNSTEHEAIVRHANSARAKMLAAKNDPESDFYQSIRNDILELDKDQVVDIVIQNEVNEKVAVVESEISEREEWVKDNYLQGLRDSWEAGLQERFHTEHDEESTAVFNELKRFAEQVAKEVEAERMSLATDNLERSLEALVDEAVKIRLTQQANMEWLKAYRKGEIVYATRDGNDHKHKLLDWNSVDDLQEEVYDRLIAEYATLRIDPIEGKG